MPIPIQSIFTKANTRIIGETTEHSWPEQKMAILGSKFLAPTVVYGATFNVAHLVQSQLVLVT